MLAALKAVHVSVCNQGLKNTPYPAVAKVVPLRGTERFSRLMRQRPIVSWGLFAIHADIAPRPETASSAPALIVAADAEHALVCLGQIIPKKTYKHAVDRNRVRRLVRAHGLDAIQASRTTMCDQSAVHIDVLFRVKTSSKKTGSKNPQTAGLDAPVNPHTQVFSQALKAGIKDAIEHVLKKAQQQQQQQQTWPENQ